MAALPSRKSLESMKRVDLQRICKDYGVKANLKSEALIDLLLDTQKPTSKPAPTRRMVSTRLASRAGPSRISSVIIHDTDEEDVDEEHEAEDENSQRGRSNGHEPNIQPHVESEHSLPPVTRTRKAKEQTRLGVGRPVAAGGAGPRAVTKSISIPRAQRGKGSRTMKPSEATILEEEGEPEVPAESLEEHNTVTTNVTSNNEIHAQDAQNTFSNDSLASLESIDKHVADALRPLHEQMESLKSELELMQSLKTEFSQLKAKVDDMGTLKEIVEALTAEVAGLRTQATSNAAIALELKQWMNSIASNPITAHTFDTPPPTISSESTERAESQFITDPISGSKPSTSSLDARTMAASPHPGIAPTMLGKRHRDSSASDMTGLMEEGDETGLLESDLAQKITRPTRKRPKIYNDNEKSEAGTSLQSSLSLEEERNENSVATRGPSFTIFSGPDEPPEQYMGPPPPTERLPDFFAPPSPPPALGPSFSRQGATGTSTANASENHQPFSFSFLPISSTPAHNMFMPSFPYPEPPQSPSPAGTSSTGFLNHHQGERTDVFQAFGLPSPVRPSRPSALRTAGMASRFVDPAELMRRASSKDRDGGSTKPGSGPSQTTMEETPSGSGSGSDALADAPEMKRTMYGTELEGDTRFGDFGVEGVGTSGAGFWAGGRY